MVSQTRKRKRNKMKAEIKKLQAIMKKIAKKKKNHPEENFFYFFAKKLTGGEKMVFNIKNYN